MIVYVLFIVYPASNDHLLLLIYLSYMIMYHYLL